MYSLPAVYGCANPVSSHSRLPAMSCATMANLTPFVTKGAGESQKLWSWQHGTYPETTGAAPRIGAVGWPVASVFRSETVYLPKPVGVKIGSETRSTWPVIWAVNVCA